MKQFIIIKEQTNGLGFELIDICRETGTELTDQPEALH